MSIHDDGAYDGYDPEGSRRSRRRKQAVVGVVGVAAVLGGGAFFVTEAMNAKQSIAPEVASAPLAPATTDQDSEAPTPSASAASAAPATRRPAAKVSRTPSPAPSESLTAEERVKAARAAAAKNGVALQRPLSGGALPAAPAGLSVTDSGSLKQDRETLRVVSARGDLTGYGELAWVADKGTAVGSATCSQTFRFANNAKPAKKPNLLVCWQTSAKKSVYTVTVNLDGRPSRQDSVAAIAKRWSSLG
jgi:hypothetical protein